MLFAEQAWQSQKQPLFQMIILKKKSPPIRITVWTLRTEKGVVTNSEARDSVRAEQNVLTKWSNANLSDADDTDNGHQSLTLSHTHQPEADGLWKWLTCACH